MSILVLGSRGMVGKAICRLLRKNSYSFLSPTRDELDLCNKKEVDYYFRYHPEIESVIVAAGRVGGIMANSNDPVSFFNDNTAIAVNSIMAADKYGINKLIYLGSSCIYPKDAPQPIKEEHLLSGPLEPTNEAYALAKIGGVKLCDFIRRTKNRQYTALMPCNLYGPGDNYNTVNSHVMPALIRKVHEAFMLRSQDNIVVWGSGKPLREFLHVDDLARACEIVLNNDVSEYIYNVGYGEDISIYDLANLIKNVVGFEGGIVFDKTKPDGVAKKLMDSEKIRKLGWYPKINLCVGVTSTYEIYRKEINDCVVRI